MIKLQRIEPNGLDENAWVETDDPRLQEQLAQKSKSYADFNAKVYCDDLDTKAGRDKYFARLGTPAYRLASSELNKAYSELQEIKRQCWEYNFKKTPSISNAGTKLSTTLGLIYKLDIPAYKGVPVVSQSRNKKRFEVCFIYCMSGEFDLKFWLKAVSARTGLKLGGRGTDDIKKLEGLLTKLIDPAARQPKVKVTEFQGGA